MDAIRKQASKLREQVAKQQQAVLKQLSGRFGSDSILVEEADLHCHEQLKRLYTSTRAGKHFQRDLARSVEGLVSSGSKQMEIVTKLADDCCKYGNGHQNDGSALATASIHFGTSHDLMERERDNLHRILESQVSEPLRTMIKGAPLEDARHLMHQYDRIRQEVDAQAAEVVKRRLKSKEAGDSADAAVKLQTAESRLSELRSTLSALGREATAAMMSVEIQQQRVTFQKLLTLVNAERSYHRSVSAILDELHAEMVLEKQHIESTSRSEMDVKDVYIPPEHKDSKSNESSDVATQKGMHFVGKVQHSFDAQADGELSLSVGDYVVVRQVVPNGWSEGECKGKAGWFPSAYIERQDKAPASEFITAIESS